MKKRTRNTKQNSRNHNTTATNSIRITLMAVLFAMMCCSGAFAEKAKDPNNAVNIAATQGMAEKALGLKENVKIDRIKFEEELNMYRIEIRGDVLFITPDMKYVVVGDIINLQTKKSLVHMPPEKVDFSALPEKDAIKLGKGKHKIALFMSVSCPHCHHQYKDLAQNENVTAYLYLYPGAEGVWCSSDRKKALDETVRTGKVPAGAKSCDVSALQRNVEFAKSKKIRGVPAIVFSNGETAVGYMNTAMLNEKLLGKGNK